MRKFIGLKTAGAALVLLAATAITLPAQTFTTLFSFDYTDSNYPQAALVQATDGNLYGTTNGSGPSYSGSVFRISANGMLKTLYSFPCSEAGCWYPEAPLVQATDGNFYGTTVLGGASDLGAVFKVTPTGTLTKLHSFCSDYGCTDGSYPDAALVQATDRNFYGTTSGGGANGYGTIFEITPTGRLTTLYSFCSQSNCTDGEEPMAALLGATDGNFYGTTRGGGANGVNICPDVGCGTVFKISPGGTLTTLYSFCSQSGCTDGSYPEAGLMQAADGNFYGTTSGGGSNSGGTVFTITPSGTLTTLYSFCSQANCADGSEPEETLIQATDGNFYGTTYGGGSNGFGGTVFEITSSGTLTTLHSFCSQSNCTDGYYPIAALVQDTNGNLYGTTQAGGNRGNWGTIFSLSMGLGPFVETQTTSGEVGIPVKILGTNLTGATSVTFNGTPAVFKVFSSSLIGAKVPAGATTGTVQVVTPGGTLSSNVPFRVR